MNIDFFESHRRLIFNMIVCGGMIAVFPPPCICGKRGHTGKFG